MSQRDHEARLKMIERELTRGKLARIARQQQIDVLYSRTHPHALIAVLPKEAK